MYPTLALFALLAFTYSILSSRIEKTPVNGALVFTAFGMLIGSLGLGLVRLEVEAGTLKFIAEATLGLVLFVDAAKVNFRVLDRSLQLPTRLLLFGLPLCIAMGYGAGLLIFEDLHALEIAVLAAMLAPTDAALGKAVISDKRVKPAIREGLNVESGLNDGICVPVVLALLAMAVERNVDGGSELPLLMLQEIGIGLLWGLPLAWLGAKLLVVARKRGWIRGPWLQSPVAALALLCFACAQMSGGSGFIASFCGGLLFGRVMKHDKEVLLEAGESVGDMLSLVIWVIFGAAVVSPNIEDFSLDILLYSLLSLTVIRMLPVVLSLWGSGYSMKQKLFIGWFGPRGLASIVFGVIVFDAQLPGGDTLTLTVICTVTLSVLLHGLSANPLVSALTGKRKEKMH